MGADFDQEAMVHSEAVYRFACKLCGNDQDAEDLLQDTFLSAFRSFHQYTAGTNCKSWLFRIAHNAFRKRWRKKENQVPKVAIDDEGGDFILHQHLMEKDKTYQDNPEKRVLEQIPSPDLREALERLSEQARTVLLLCDVEDLSYQEVADILGVPLGTVRSRLSRARSSVQRFLVAKRAK